jgi:GH25 family lysozyme M1 (1,4-beta-N-acetylmuramidase)
MAEGLDIYTKYQSVNDWGAVRRSGRTFAYFKGTDGMTTRDTANWPQAAKAAGIACGLYGYAQPGSAADQYDLLLRTARARSAVDLSPALDLEDPFVPGNAATQFAIAWLRRAVDAGQIPVFYANDSMMGYLLATVRNAVPSVWPWIARYGARPKNPFRTWQHSSSGVVPGIKASGVDLNTGEAPIRTPNTPPIIPEEIMRLAEPHALEPSSDWQSRTFAVETGALASGGNSTVVATMWFNLTSSDFGDSSASTEYRLWVGNDAGQWLGFGDGSAPAEGKITGNGFRQLVFKPGSRMFTLEWKNNGRARAGFSFPQVGQ